MIRILLAAALAFSSCGAPAQKTFNPALHHFMTFTMPRGCADRDVTVLVDGERHPFPENSKVLQVSVAEGIHEAVQLVGNYEVRRWRGREVDRDTYITLECFRSTREQSVPEQRKP